MALRKNLRRHHFSAKLVTEDRIPCAFCQRDVDDELIYGKLYAIGDIQCHYYCVLLSSCLVQKGKDDEGLFGFLYHDILAEVERSKKHKCSYCGRDGATLGCAVGQCRKQFHLPCGRERNAVSLFFGNYKSFCQLHAHKQKIPEDIMQKVRLRRKEANKKIKCAAENLEVSDLQNENPKLDPECVCVICYEEVDAYPSLHTFWPPCCARDAWFHRTCLQRMALSAGMHYLKCPLCNDKENFYEAVINQGYYVPDRDAAWELEQNAFAEIYERVLRCSADECNCPMGRSYDAEEGSWDIISCLLCGGVGWHRACVGHHSIGPAPDGSSKQSEQAEQTEQTEQSKKIEQSEQSEESEQSEQSEQGAESIAAVCSACRPAAPADLHALAARIHAVAQRERQHSHSATRVARHVMPSRMSLRRTKRAAHALRTECPRNEAACLQNLKSPKKAIERQPLSDLFTSPTKLIEQGFKERAQSLGVKMNLDVNVLDRVKDKLNKPKPLSAKKKVINDILDSILDRAMKEPEEQDEPKEWCSPKKCQDAAHTQQDSPTQEVKQEVEIKKDPEVEPTVCDTLMPAESDDSSSTFQLPAEFVADHNSDDSLPIFNTPKKLKTVDIQKDSSLEISANDQSVNIDVVKMEENDNVDFLHNLNIKSPVRNKKCAFKFSPLDKETLQENNIGIDLECFKNHYLNEVVREFPSEAPAETVLNVEQTKINRKRKMRTANIANKKRKIDKRKKRRPKGTDKVKFKFDKRKMREKRKEMKKKLKTRVSLSNVNIKVKIKWKTEQLNVKITETKKRRMIKKKRTKLKQYVLQYAADSVKDVLVKPEKDVTPLKRKYVKQERSPDKLVQTSIQSFFTIKPPKH